MKDSNVFEYMTMEQTLGLGLFINTITYSLIGDVKTKVFDPVFEEIFPQEYFLLKINLGKKTVDLGGAAYEIFRWVNYATFIYFCARVLFEYLPNPVSFLWLFTPFVLLLAMRKMFVQDVSPSLSGDQTTIPSEQASENEPDTVSNGVTTTTF